MKRLSPRSRLVAVLTAVILSASTASLVIAGDEKPMPAGSTRPTSKVKKAALPGLAKISFEAALKAALSAHPGKLLKGKIEIEDGTLIYAFEIVLADQSVVEVAIDAGNGNVLASEVENPEKEEHGKGHEDDDDDDHDHHDEKKHDHK
jgi:hypothetical protein